MDRLLRTVSTMGSCKNGAGVKVTVCGAGGGIGQPLSLMLKKMCGISALNLYDVSPMVKGVAADLSHINTPAKITGFVGKELNAALQGADIVVIPAGVPRKPGMTRDDLFKINAGIICNLVAACAQSCPNAYILIVTNPVNSTVPIAAAVLKRMGCYNPKKLLGVTTLDVVRSNTFLSEKLGVSPCKVNVPVVGGHAGITIIPLFSQVPASSQLSEEDIKGLTNHVMFGGDEVVKAKAGRGSATLSMAHAAAHLVEAILKSYKGQPVTECAFVESNVYPGLPFFASPVVLTPAGVAAVPALPEMSAYEQQLTKAAVADLSKQITKGTKYGQAYKLPVA